MSATKEFFAIWLQENVGNLSAESEVSVAVLAQQFEQDADAAGYGREVRDDEIGNVEDAIAEALKVGTRPTTATAEMTDLVPVMDWRSTMPRAAHNLSAWHCGNLHSPRRLLAGRAEIKIALTREVQAKASRLGD